MTNPATNTAEHLDRFLAGRGDELVAFRRHLHAHPELSWEEHRTSAAIRERLEQAGLHPEGLETDTGLSVDLGRDGDGPTVLLRADIDALPLDDEKDVPYRSISEGVCHACGHDVHTAAALGATLALAPLMGERRGRVRILFQPAEEAIPGGARALYDTAVMDGVDVVYALHCDPGLAVGQVGLKSGPITSAADRVTIRLKGPGGHTARPHLSVDLLAIVGRIITELPAGLARLTDSRDGASLVFGAVEAGHAANVIPTHAELRGTLRVRGRETWDAAAPIIERLVAAAAEPYGAAWEIDHVRGSPPVDNDADAVAVLHNAVTAALGVDAVATTAQSVGNEDFSWLLERAPGAYARLGVQPIGATARLELHAGAFDVDEACIGVGVRVLTHAALAALDSPR
jgi:amidohydrolase